MPTDPRAEIIRIGEYAFGPRWQTSLARALGVSDRTVRRWVAGVWSPAPETLARARELLIEDRVGQALAAVDDLVRQSGPVAEIHLAEPADPADPLAREITRRVGAALTARGIRAEIVPVSRTTTDPAKRAVAAGRLVAI